MRVTRSRELVAEGHSPSAVARVAQISRQAIYRVPKTRPARAGRSAPPVCEVDAAIVAVAKDNQTDGYRMVCALVSRKLGRAVNRKARPARDARAAPDPAPPALGSPPPAWVLSGHAPRRALASGHDVGLGRRARLVLPDGRDRLLHPRDRRLAPRAALPRHR